MMKILVGFFGLLGLIAVLVWSLQFPNYMACLDNNKISDSECFNNFLMLSPPIQEAQELQQACDSPDSDCYIKIGQKVVEEKLTT